MAGTQLRAMILRLLNPTGDAKKLFDALGISVTNASGQLKSLPDIIGSVSKAFEGLTETKKAEYAATLVGMEATSGLITLLSAGADELRNYTDMLHDAAGTAQDLADTQTDNLNGAITELKSALEAVNITVGNKFIPTIRQAATALTEAALKFKDLSPEAQNAVLAFTSMAAAGGTLITTIYALRTALMALQVSVPILLGISAAIGAISAAVAYFTTKANEAEAAIENITLGFDDQTQSAMQLTREIEALETELQNLTEDTDEYNRANDELHSAYQQILAANPDLQKGFEENGSSLQWLQEEVRKLSAEYTAMRENAYNSQWAMLEAQISEKQNLRSLARKEVAEWEERFGDQTSDIVQKQIENKREEAELLKSDIVRLQQAQYKLFSEYNKLNQPVSAQDVLNRSGGVETGGGGIVGYDPLADAKEKEARKKREKTREEILREMARADEQYLEYKRGINQMSLEQEIVFLERMQEKYKEVTDLRYRYEARAYQAQKQLAEDTKKAQELAAKEAFEFSVNWIEAEERRMIEAGATEEQITQMKFDAWSRVKNRYAEDTEFYKRADSEVFAHKQRLIEQATAMQLEALTKQRDMQRQALAEMNRAAEDALRKQIADERAKTDSVTESIKRQTDAVRERYNAQIEGIRREIAAIDEEIRKQNELDRIEDRRAKRAELQAKRDAILADERFEKVVMGEDGQLTTIRTHDTAAIDEIDKQLRDLDIEEEREKRRQALDERKRQLNDEISAINAKRDAEIAALQAEVEAVNKARDEKITAMQTELEAMQETNKTKLEALDTYWADVLDKDKIAQDVRNEVLQEGLDEGLRKITSHLDAVMTEYQSKISAMIAMGESLSASLPMGGGIAGVSNTTNHSNSVNINSVNVTANNGNDFVNSLRRSYFS